MMLTFKRLNWWKCAYAAFGVQETFAGCMTSVEGSSVYGALEDDGIVESTVRQAASQALHMSLARFVQGAYNVLAESFGSSHLYSPMGSSVSEAENMASHLQKVPVDCLRYALKA